VQAVPDTIEEYLEHGDARCFAFNRRGTLLAGAPAHPSRGEEALGRAPRRRAALQAR
jgi:hypothetical protein